MLTQGQIERLLVSLRKQYGNLPWFKKVLDYNNGELLTKEEINHFENLSEINDFKKKHDVNFFITISGSMVFASKSKNNRLRFPCGFLKGKVVVSNTSGK